MPSNADRSGMCGMRSPETSFGARELCVLAAGHDGWHEAATLLTEKFGIVPPLRWGLARDMSVEEQR